METGKDDGRRGKPRGERVKRRIKIEGKIKRGRKEESEETRKIWKRVMMRERRKKGSKGE